MKKTNKYSHFITKQNNIIQFDFARYYSNERLNQIRNRLKIPSHITPKKLRKKYQDFISDISISFEDFISFIQKENLWQESYSLKLNLEKYLKKDYGPNKIQFLLKENGFQEEKIIKELHKIPEEFWIQKAKTIAKKVQNSKYYMNISVQQKNKKIYYKLHYCGFSIEQIQQILSSIFNVQK